MKMLEQMEANEIEACSGGSLFSDIAQWITDKMDAAIAERLDQ